LTFIELTRAMTSCLAEYSQSTTFINLTTHVLPSVLIQRFSPTFRSDEMRHRLSDGNVDAPLLIYVGRIGAEKKLHRLRKGT
jgi:hypothetical protein